MIRKLSINQILSEIEEVIDENERNATKISRGGDN